MQLSEERVFLFLHAGSPIDGQHGTVSEVIAHWNGVVEGAHACDLFTTLLCVLSVDELRKALQHHIPQSRSPFKSVLHIRRAHLAQQPLGQISAASMQRQRWMEGEQSRHSRLQIGRNGRRALGRSGTSGDTFEQHGGAFERHAQFGRQRSGHSGGRAAAGRRWLLLLLHSPLFDERIVLLTDGRKERKRQTVQPVMLHGVQHFFPLAPLDAIFTASGQRQQIVEQLHPSGGGRRSADKTE